MRTLSFGAIGLSDGGLSSISIHCIHHFYNSSRPPTAQLIIHRGLHSLREGVYDARKVDNSDAELLQRAKRYNISSIEELDIQSRYSGTRNPLQLVQQGSFRTDLNLWKLLVDYQARYHGGQGVKSVCYLLKNYVSIVRLGADDHTASTIWQQMLKVAAHDTTSSGLMEILCERHGIGWSRPELFSEVMVAYLDSHRVDEAVSRCGKLLENCYDRSSAALKIMKAYRPDVPTDITQFYQIYNQMRPLKVYDNVLRELWSTKRNREAVLLHDFLIAQGDMPSKFAEIENLFVHLAEMNADYKPYVRRMLAVGIDYAHQSQLTYEIAQQNTVADGSRKQNSSRNKRSLIPNTVSDSFAAKAFTTRALSFEFVVNSLKAFGLTEVGPQTIREIGLKAGNLEVFAQRLASLYTHRIDTGASAYVRTVRRLCQTRRSSLLNEVLNTDIHHDVFEDVHLQRRLLATHLESCDWRKVNLILAMLSCGQVDGPAAKTARSAVMTPAVHKDNRQREFLNYSLQVGALANGPQLGLDDVVKQMVRGMREQKTEQLTKYQQLQWARFMAGFMQQAVLNGHQFGVRQWRYVLARLASTGMPDTAIGIIYWLVRAQIRRTKASYGFPPIRPEHEKLDDKNLIRRLISKEFQRVMMHCSLKYSFSKKSTCSRASWANLLELFYTIERDYGIRLDTIALQQVVVMRCRYLRPKPRPAPERVRNGVLSPSHLEKMNRTAWKECSRIISKMHDLWAIPPKSRRADLDRAFVSMFKKTKRRTRPFTRRHNRVKSE